MELELSTTQNNDIEGIIAPPRTWKPDTFHSFPKLPPELRLAIREEAITSEPGRVVTLHTNALQIDHPSLQARLPFLVLSSRFNGASHKADRITVLPPTRLHSTLYYVNKEAQEMQARNLQCRPLLPGEFGDRDYAAVVLDLNKDILLFTIRQCYGPALNTVINGTFGILWLFENENDTSPHLRIPPIRPWAFILPIASPLAFDISHSNYRLRVER